MIVTPTINNGYIEGDPITNYILLNKLIISQNMDIPDTIRMLEIKPTIDKDFKNEHYKLSLKQDKVCIVAGDQAGINNGILTLKNYAIHNPKKTTFTLYDEPKNHHREFMLDVTRHFFDIKEILKLLNEMALLKINKFHLHLSDNEAFRVESKLYPKLNQGKPFYTQDEIRCIINYANNLGIEIIPEFDMPSHAKAIIDAYPNLGFKNTLFITQPETINFLANLIGEMIRLFPGQYFHIGSDEINKKLLKEDSNLLNYARKNNLNSIEEIQGDFINKLNALINEEDKKTICWTEAGFAKNLNPEVIIQNWTNYPFDQNIQRENRNHRPFIASNALNNYFNYPLWAMPLIKTFMYEPNINREKINNLLGTSCHLWTELLKTPEDLEKQLFPRLEAFAENTWATKKSSYQDYLKRTKKYLENLKKRGINSFSMEEITNPPFEEVKSFFEKRKDFPPVDLPIKAKLNSLAIGVNLGLNIASTYIKSKQNQ